MIYLQSKPSNNKFHIRYRNRRKAQDYCDNENAELSVESSYLMLNFNG